MPCEGCGAQFSVFRRRRACAECARWYCGACLRRGGGALCAPCRALTTRPLAQHHIAHLKVKDLQCFLQRQNVSTRGCVEKDELLSLCVYHVNGTAFRRRARTPGAFSSLKGFTSNINELINQAFDMRTAQPAPAPPQHQEPGCYNSSHAHAYGSVHAHSSVYAHPIPPYAGGHATPLSPDGGAFVFRRPADVAPAPAADGDVSMSSRSSSLSARVDTADCFEVEDLDDTGWEFVNRPADPLPTDSEVLLTVEPDGVTRAAGTPQRAASAMDLSRSASRHTDTASLQDEPLFEPTPEPELEAEPVPAPDTGQPEEVDIDTEPDAAAARGGKRLSLSELESRQQLEALNVRQLKELLAANRVDFRGCLERDDLLERARTLWLDHAKYKELIETLPLEECCKICMAAPLECVLLECGHMAACTRCGKGLAECPICRRYVTRAVRVFRS